MPPLLASVSLSLMQYINVCFAVWKMYSGYLSVFANLSTAQMQIHSRGGTPAWQDLLDCVEREDAHYSNQLTFLSLGWFSPQGTFTVNQREI